MAFKTAPMSTAQNEAENGPAMFREDNHNHGEEDLEGDGWESAGDFPLKFSGRIEITNGDGDGNIVVNASATSRGYQNPDQKYHEADSNLESSTTLERPSSADGSLSIPDDTPSIQVGSHPASRQLVTDLNVARSPNYLLQADRRFFHPMLKAQPLIYAPSTDAFKLVFLLLLSAHLGLLHRPHLVHVPANHLCQVKYTAIQVMRNNLIHHGRLLGGQSLEILQIRLSLRLESAILEGLRALLFQP